MAKNIIKSLTLASVLVLVFAFASLAATQASDYWYQSGSDWLIKQPGASGPVTNAWVCDNFNNPADTNSNWYYLTANGKMAEGVLISDGHAYLLETEHSGHYGMMLAGQTSRMINGHTLTFNSEHNGSYGAITAIDGNGAFDLNTVGAVLGLKQSSAVAGAPSEYTANWGSGQTQASTGLSAGFSSRRIVAGSISTGHEMDSNLEGKEIDPELARKYNELGKNVRFSN